MSTTKQPWLALIGPGVLIAATGVGAGDLATASFAGNKLGTAVLWAVLVGAFFKYCLNEGLARWQLASNTSLLEGCIRHFGLFFQVPFLIYFLLWSLFVGSALMGACGITMQAMAPIFGDPVWGKFWLGICHSLVGVLLVLVGGFKLFERVMALCIGIMFVTILLTAWRLTSDWGAIAQGIYWPSIPAGDGEGFKWIVALMGGVGGTLTLLCYGYWIREVGREDIGSLRVTRIDLATGYTMTALFGMAVIIIGAQTPVEGKGAGLIVALAANLETSLGPIGKWAFLLGAWGAVFSSLLGVWQSVPYLFADFCRQSFRQRKGEVVLGKLEASWHYRAYLVFLALAPISVLHFGFRDIQKYYALIGASFMPFLALALLYLNGRTSLVGAAQRNRAWTTGLLAGIVVFFLLAGWHQVVKAWGVNWPVLWK